jgi:shikimate dehydrogenase
LEEGLWGRVGGLFFITGKGISYTLSPLMYNTVFSEHGVDAYYSVLEAVDEDHLGRIVGWCRQDEYCLGFNVTKPYKTIVLRMTDSLDKTAAEVGAVNTVARSNGVLVAYNTDWYGVIGPLARFDSPAVYDDVLVIGAGGAARAAAYALRDRVHRLYVVSRSGALAVELASWARERWGIEARGYRASRDIYGLLLGRVDLVINASPASGSDKSPIPLDELRLLRPPCTVMDMVYVPLETLLLAKAADLGCRVLDGLWMLVYQAVLNLRLWLSLEISPDKLRSLVLRQSPG